MARFSLRKSGDLATVVPMVRPLIYPSRTSPFLAIHDRGLVHIERRADEAFRKALMDGVPMALRSKMREALAAIPDAGSLAHSRRYFGDGLQEIADRAKPLVDELHRYMETRLKLSGFREWMIATGYTNEYRMIKVFEAWSRMKAEPKPKIVAADG